MMPAGIITGVRFYPLLLCPHAGSEYLLEMVALSAMNLFMSMHVGDFRVNRDTAPTDCEV